MSNSPLVNYTRISPNHSNGRKHPIDTITIHCVVGQASVETLGNVFAPVARQAASNYGVGFDGKIGLYVNECDRSWCTGGKDKAGNVIKVNGISGADNDERAVTIEVASDTVEPYAVTDAALNSLIILVADICKRNRIKKLLWLGDKTLVGNVAQQNMTVHRWFSTKSCPGTYLYNLHGVIAAKVNAKLAAADIPPASSKLYRVQVGAFASYDNAQRLKNELTSKGYSPFITT